MEKFLKPFEEAVMQECLQLKQGDQVSFENLAESYNAIFQMAGFMLSPLEPGMFIPMEGNEPLAKPKLILGTDEVTEAQEAYQKAESMVIFEGFAYEKGNEAEEICIPNTSIVVFKRYNKSPSNQWESHYSFVRDIAHLNIKFKTD